MLYPDGVLKVVRPVGVFSLASISRKPSGFPKNAQERSGRVTFEGESGTQGAVPCWLCCRPLGQRCEWHHPVPKSRGGRDVVPLHPICHRTIHACFDNARLARIGGTGLRCRKTQP
jgi:hypothetical protein